MSKKSVFCIATSRDQADRIVDRLKNANFSNNDISALFADKNTSHDFAHEKNTKAPEGAVTGAAQAACLAEHSDGSLASALWPFLASVPSSPPDPSWLHLAVLPLVPLSVELPVV
jgi:hypothetical protein